MPTINVGPGSGLELQEIADTLGKSRKVVVVTGAGISTNCGIPDFRSENGLYSLIQAQYDAALQNPPWENTDNFDIDDRPRKKRRVTDRWYYEIVPGTGPAVQDTNTQPSEDADAGSPRSQSIGRTATSRSTRAARFSPDSSPLSSPRSITPPLPNELQIEGSPIISPVTRSSFASVAPSRSRSLRSESSRSSSVFTGDDNSKETLSQSDSSAPSCSAKTDDITTANELEQEPQFPSSPPSSSDDISRDASQPSQSTTTRTLPNLKGRDLFDSMVWSDPFTTSIFYMFITSLRQKIRNDVKSTTRTHKFIRTLRDGGRLVRNYTQNIDCLEEREGLCTDLSRGAGSKTRFQAKILREPRPRVVEGDSPLNGGVECVLLHGSLVELRCGICATLCSWEMEDRQSTTLSGSAPDCPSCTEYNARRTGRGRRGLAVGRLRPDIVLYGEEHPKANLIAPLITNDLSLGPDFLLIMGTSLKVHGLKYMVKEFAKAVHLRGGKVVFVNNTKPPESTWGDFIDYWVEWDCDEWVLDLQERREDIWLPQGSQVTLNNRRESTNDTKMEKPSKAPRIQVSRPQAVRDDKMNGVYHTFKILDSLRQIEDSSGAQSTRPIYWEKTGKPAPAPAKIEPPKQARKSIPALKPPNKQENSKKRKSYPSVLPSTKSNENATEFWDRLRKLAPGLKPTPPEIGRIPLKDLHYNRDFPVHNLFMNITRSFADQSTNRFPWLDGLTLITHPPSGAEPPIHTPKKVEKPTIPPRPVTHAYGTRASARFSGISAKPAMSDPASETSNESSTIVVDDSISHPCLSLQTSNESSTIVVDASLLQLPTSEISNGNATIAVDDTLPRTPLRSGNATIVVDDKASLPSFPSPSTGNAIIAATTSIEDEKPPTPPTSDPMTPSSRRIKRMGSIGAILSSPEDGSRSSASAGTVYYDAEEA